MHLSVVKKEHALKICEWRNQDISMYRTPYFLTEEMQLDFYRDVICNRNSAHRYYSVMSDDNKQFFGMVGLTNISYENRNAEISIVIDPSITGKGYGHTAVDLLLKEGFNNVNLENIYGECYVCSKSLHFWKSIGKKYNLKENYLPMRKYLNGCYYDSLYFTINKNEILKLRKEEGKECL